MTERQEKWALERYEEGLDHVANIAHDYGIEARTLFRLARARKVRRFSWTGWGRAHGIEAAGSSRRSNPWSTSTGSQR